MLLFDRPLSMCDRNGEAAGLAAPLAPPLTNHAMMRLSSSLSVLSSEPGRKEPCRQARWGGRSAADRFQRRAWRHELEDADSAMKATSDHGIGRQELLAKQPRPRRNRFSGHPQGTQGSRARRPL